MQNKFCKNQQYKHLLSIGISLGFSLQITTAIADSYAPWLTQIGVSDKVLSASNWGKGMLLGVVDTGVVANNPSFATGQVSNSLSACAAVSFRCSNGFTDDNGHGTAVAEIAAGNRKFAFSTNYGGYAVAANSVVSVAPNANIVAEKVLNAQGSAYSTDVANGVRKAADAGATVINVSITFGNTADIVSAINYATSKGAFIVWAGGNSATTLLGGANTSGLTATAIRHLLFAGSVNAKNSLSSFSNTAGSGALINTSGTKTAYANRWIMAPGENILAPYIQGGSNAWAYWSGTSMSTPLVSGSLILLESAWPILKTNGTAANLLLSTSTDLGTKGVDASYGFGLVNLNSAFQPYGTLTVTGSNGKSYAVPSLTGSLLSSGALGSLSSIQAKLANYTAFDTYSRNFTVNLAGMIKSPTSGAILNPLPTNTNTGPASIKFADGTEMSYWQSSPAYPSEQPLAVGVIDQGIQARQSGYFMLNSKDGTSMAMGFGYPVQYAFAKASFGNEDLARLSAELSTTNFSALAQGGGIFTYGTALNENTRLAFSWSGSAPAIAEQPMLTQDASQITIGLTHQFNQILTAGVTFANLSEKNGLLGSVYNSDSAVNLGHANQSYNIGLSAGFNFDKNNSLLIEAGFANTAGTTTSGLLVGTSNIESRSYGMTFMNKNLIQKNDRLMLSIKQPLRVSSGQIGVLTSAVDAQGYAQYTTEWASLVPTGREIDLKMSYDTPLTKDQSLSLQAGYRKDVLNISGNNDSNIGAAWTMRF